MYMWAHDCHHHQICPEIDARYENSSQPTYIPFYNHWNNSIHTST
uniref:Uncharacterized protein n=1 Tax=Arundo donax TaxID=35708 RepID=A0A0A8ZIH4_ARUDO